MRKGLIGWFWVSRAQRTAGGWLAISRCSRACVFSMSGVWTSSQHGSCRAIRMLTWWVRVPGRLFNSLPFMTSPWNQTASLPCILSLTSESEAHLVSRGGELDSTSWWVGVKFLKKHIGWEISLEILFLENIICHNVLKYTLGFAFRGYRAFFWIFTGHCYSSSVECIFNFWGYTKGIESQL